MKLSPSLPQKPPWIRRSLELSDSYGKIDACVKKHGLHTVCIDAKCPNKHECFSQGKATFLLMGPSCTRNCRFCNITTSKPPFPIDTQEPLRIAAAVSDLGLKRVVLTMVTRDDMPDGGAALICETVERIKKNDPAIYIEVLTSDFKGKFDNIDMILNADIQTFSHNIETVQRLYNCARPQADYRLSLDILRYSAAKGADTKTAIMVGLGETDEEVDKTIQDIARTGCRTLAIGQYLQPSREHLPVQRYVNDAVFSLYKNIAKAYGILHSYTGSFIRSSYI